MTTVFSTKTNTEKFPKRVLRLESLENRELLSVNPLGGNNPYFSQTVTESQNVQTEADELNAAFSAITVSSVKTDGSIFTVLDVTPGEIAVTGGTTVTGLTTSAATITLQKVKGAAKYEVIIDNGDTARSITSTKNQIVLTNLEASTQYSIQVIFKNKNNETLDLTGKIIATGISTIDLGAFSTWANVSEEVKNPPINGGIAAAYAATGKDYDGTALKNGIKVTWKTPANYTGAYTVIVEDSVGKKATKTIPAGFKTEAFVTKEDDTSGQFTVTQNAYYKVTVITGRDVDVNAVKYPTVVVATGSNKIENYLDPTLTGVAVQTSNKIPKVITSSVYTLETIAINASWMGPDVHPISIITGYFITIMEGKGIVYQGVVSGNNNKFDSRTVDGLMLVPGLKYDVLISALGNDGSENIRSVAVKSSVTLAKFSEATLTIPKDSKAGLSTAHLQVQDKISYSAYVIQYTSITDAKGKPDWSAAETLQTTYYYNTTIGYSYHGVTMTNLNAGTQYFARAVAYDPYEAGNEKTEKDSSIIVIGKEFKFKTVAIPLATVTKSGLTLDGYDLAFKFTGKVPVDKTGKSAVFPAGTTKFYYEIIVSTDAVIDKTTGKLVNGQSFTSTPQLLTQKGGNGKDKNDFIPVSLKLTESGNVFDKLNANLLDPASFKALNFQLFVYYTLSDADNAYAAAYTKAAKLAMPKWYVS
jgi:hypothetical protein